MRERLPQFEPHGVANCLQPDRAGWMTALSLSTPQWLPHLFGVVINLKPHDHYFHLGFIVISLANLLVIGAMLILFVLAILLPFVHGRQKGPHQSDAAALERTRPRELDAAREEDTRGLWTAAVRRAGLRLLPPEKLLPDDQPAYVSSWIYVFGVLALSGFVVVVLSGAVLALKGPTWWHTSIVGHFVNSLHLWSVELFMAFMVIHLWGKFWMAAWRGKRRLTWMTGVVAFVLSIFEAYTGYLSQTNFDSQWIAFESKDAFNASGIGAFVNTMNFGQALMLHIVFVPLVLALLIGVHVALVRIRGVVHPIDADPGDTALDGAAPVRHISDEGTTEESPCVGQDEEQVGIPAGAVPDASGIPAGAVPNNSEGSIIG